VGRFAVALVGVALVVLAPAAYVPLMSNATARSTGWPAFVVAGVGVALAGWAAVVDPRKRTRACAVLALLGTATWTWLFFGAMRLPQSGLAALTTAPDFTLPDELGHPVSLSTLRAKGPVLLVFYRGWW
jgi:cytochrome oxidase Cu insertion factor (SCO1/SenC/PrrC family)